MSDAPARPELSPEWITAAVRRTRVFGIAVNTLKVHPVSITPRENDPKTFDIVMPFKLQTEPYEGEGSKKGLGPEDHFRSEVEAAIDVNKQPLGFKIGDITVAPR